MIARGRRRVGILLGTGFRAAPLTAVLTLALSLIAAACSVLYTVGLKVIVDGALAHSESRIILGAALTGGLFTASWLLAVIAGSRGSLLTDKCNLVLGMRIARLAARLPTLEHFEDPEQLRRIDLLTRGRRTLAGAPRQIMNLLAQGLRATGTIVLLALIYPPVLLVPLLAFVPALAERRGGRVLRASDEVLAEDRRMLDELFTVATTASSARELRTYGLTEALPTRHAALARRIRGRTVRAAVRAALWEAAGWAVFAAGLVAAIVVLVLRGAHGEVSVGAVVEAVTLMRRVQTHVSRSTDTASSFSTSLGAADELIWLQDREAETASRPASAVVPSRLRHGIELRGVTFAYPGAVQPALGPLQLTLPAGASVALVGENGAGKTTLVKLLCGMYAPTSGEILVDGAPLSELAVAPWRERVSAAFQDFVRFELALGESVGVGDLPRRDEEPIVADALTRADAAALARRLPDGVRTRIGSRFTGGRPLSGGEWQRVALARGLMRCDPLLAVLDEPTASLDAPTEAALFHRYISAARALGGAQGTITLLVSHRFSTARAADLIVVLEDGRVVETGSHRELMSAAGTYAELFALQARAYA